MTQELQQSNRGLYILQQKLGSQFVQDEDTMEAHYAPQLEITESLNLLRFFPKQRTRLQMLHPSPNEYNVLWVSPRKL